MNIHSFNSSFIYGGFTGLFRYFTGYFGVIKII